MSAINGAVIVVASAIALYTGIRTIDNIMITRHNKRVMGSEKVLTVVLEEQFAELTPERKEKFMNLDGVQDVITEFQKGARTVESLKHMLTFYRRNFV